MLSVIGFQGRIETFANADLAFDFIVTTTSFQLQFRRSVDLIITQSHFESISATAAAQSAPPTLDICTGLDLAKEVFEFIEKSANVHEAGAELLKPAVFLQTPARKSQQLEMQAIRLGISHFFEKPLDLGKLRRALIDVGLLE